MMAISYSRITSHAQCPKRFKEEYVTKTVPYVKSQAQIDGDVDHQTLAAHAKDQEQVNLPDRLKYCAPIIDRVLTQYGEIYVEQNWAFDIKWNQVEWFSKDAWLRVQADLVGVNGQKAEIIDWKSGKIKIDSDQLMLYAMSTFLRHPKVRGVKAKFVFYNYDAQPELEYKRSQLRMMQQRVKGWSELIETAIRHDNFPANPGPLCRWCPLTPQQCKYRES